MTADVGPLDGFGSARAPARGRFRLFALSLSDDDAPPVVTIGVVDVTRDRSLQINLVPTRRRVLGLWRRPALLTMPWACEGGEGWPLVGRGSARLDFGIDLDGPHTNDVLLPLRAAGPDLATALVLLRAESEHSITVPPAGRQVRLTTNVDQQGVLRVDVHDDAFHTPVFLAPADATDHDLLPDHWPPLTQDRTIDVDTEYAPFMPPLWRAAADLLREACRRV